MAYNEGNTHGEAETKAAIEGLVKSIDAANLPIFRLSGGLQVGAQWESL
ncbi:MAG: hypothetical protein HQL05_08445 [Nitrospirae bacterium]|nr:hypothetical protein [Nitrospirota bacterium]